MDGITVPDPGDPIWWRCSECETLNVDWRGGYSRPICGGCAHDYSWKHVQGMSLDKMEDTDRERRLAVHRKLVVANPAGCIVRGSGAGG